MILETERLILRPWKETDANDLFMYAMDPSVGPIAGWAPHTSVDYSLDKIRNVLAFPETYAVCLKSDCRAIGNIALSVGSTSSPALPPSEGEISYWLGSPFWGNGIMPEALNELVRHAFADLHLNTLWCGYFDGNHRSKRCQEKAGFVYHHTKKNILWSGMNDVRTEQITRLTQSEWRSQFKCRLLEKNEVTTALLLAWKVFLEFEAPVYPKQGVAEFRKCLDDKEYLEGIDYYGIFDKDRLTGFVGIRNKSAHICFFFVDSGYQRLGLGTQLFEMLKKDYKNRSITLNSSPYGLSFYRHLGFIPADHEQTVNGITFTPMIMKSDCTSLRLIKLTERRDLKEKAAHWFSEKWGIPVELYIESIEDSFSSIIPSWYLCLDDDKIVGGMGVIENDFHSRHDLTPNVCAVYTEPEYRNRGIAGKLLDYVCTDMASHDINTLYLLTDHTSFYERYGWEYYCMVQGDGDENMSRMYIHRKRNI